MGFTLELNGTVAQKRLVKMDGAKAVHNTATATDQPVGVADYGGSSGELVNVTSLNEADPVEMTAAGAVTAGVALYAAADGKVQALPTAGGTYRKVAIALEAATADGDIINCLPCNDGTTVTVN